MARRSWVTGAILMCALALMVMTPVAAFAQHVNTDCALCHGGDSIVENAIFGTGLVNRDAVCRKCHQDGLVGTHPKHYAGGNCGAICHGGHGSSLAANVPSFLGSAGAFASPESQNLPAFQLHAIHSTPRWAAGLSTTDSKCASCHATAACTACHDGSVGVDPGHAVHGATRTGSTKASATVDPWVGDLAVGVTSSQSEDTLLRGTSLLCGGTACHDLAGTKTSAPFNMDSFNHPAYSDLGYVATTVVKSGTWREMSSTNYSLQRQVYSNYNTATFSITFTGERVTLISDRDPYRGIAEISIDGQVKGTVDQYNSITQYQRSIWTSDDLGPGQHTITVRPTGTRNPSARATHVTIDKIQVYDSAADVISPNCTSCHPAMGDDDHGGEHPTSFTFSHDMTQTIAATNIWNTGYGTHSCDQCHQTPLRNEHRRPTASGITAPDSCSVCHPAYVGYAWTDTYVLTDGCSYGTCHAAGSPREKHGNYAVQHTPTSAGESIACNGCHAGDLRVVHNNTVPGNGKVEANGCLACHSAAKLDTNKSCSGTNSASGSCHVGGFNTVTTHAIKSAGSHEASEAGKPFTSTYQAVAGLDDGGYQCSVCHSSGLVAAHSKQSPAVGCATGGIGGKGCHLDTAYNSVAVASAGWTSRKCSDCHDYAAKRSHDSTLTPHLVANNGCAGTGSGCHNTNDLWALHNRSQAGAAPKYQSCVNAGCHDSLAKDGRPAVNYANACGSTSTGCHTAFAPDHTGNFQHTFSATSYYNGATETGCTNQTGCHNQGVASTVDFGAGFHPDTGCIAGGACHGTNPSKAAFTGQLPTDCQECHTAGAYAGSAYQGAAPRTNLTAAPGVGGHYSETTHTANSMNIALNAGGSAAAQCSQCHSPSVGGSANGLTNQHTSIVIAGSPYGAALSCGECHGDTRARGNAEVAVNWTNNLCSDCHAAGTSSVHDHGSSVPAVAESGSTCGATGNGCHTTTDLHALHKNAAGCNLTGCHIYTQQAFRPTAKGCGGATSCHAGYTNAVHGGTATGNETTHTAAAMTTVLDAAYNAGGANTCNACHSAGLESAHAATITGNLGWTAPMCLECHNSSSPVNSVNVIKTSGWPAKACDECHGAPNGPAKHVEYGTGHTGVEAAGCTWSASCHGNTRDLRALHNNSVTSNASTAGCDSSGCHDSLNKEMQSASKTCGSGGTGCHTEKTHDNHGAAAAHGYTVASDYSQTADGIASEAGCSGSGAGCHGTVGSRNGVDEFHAAKTAGCMDTDACHGNAAFNQAFRDAGSGTDCVRCHNTTAFGATVDDMPLSGLSPAGHYPDALHTATAGLGNVNAGGSAQAACSSCHSLSLKDAHGAARTGFSSTTKGAYVTCQECHEYNINVISQVKTANWSTNACADCHAIGVLGASRVQHGNAPVVAEQTTTCGSTGINCHNSSDLHFLHRNAASGCALTGCHDFTKQAALPTIKSCGVGGGCHTAYTSDTHTHTLAGGDAAKHQPTSSVPASDTTYFGTQCGLCHDMRTSQSSLTLEHALGTSAKSGVPANSCRNCHNNSASTTAVSNNWSAKNTAGMGATSSCGVCHQSGSLAIHVDASSTAHASVSTGCANTGVGCHSGDLSSVGATATAANTVIHNSCLRCHSRTGAASWTSAMALTGANLQYVPSVKSCGASTGCHTSTFYTTTTHRATLANPVTGNDTLTHQAGGMASTMTSGTASAACSACHSATLLAAHDPAKTTNNLGSGNTAWSSTAATTCQDCHNSTVAPAASSAAQVKGHWTNNLCTDCHTPSYHNTYASGHTAPATGQNCGGTGAGCHNTYDLALLHGKTRTNGCQVTGCHDAIDKNMTSATKSCGAGIAGSCHNAYTNTSHGIYTTANDTTHTATAGMASTITSGAATAACSVCHSAQLGSAHAVATITSNLGSGHTAWTNLCTNCHNENRAPTASASTQVKDPANWSTNSCVDCHTPSYHNTYTSGHVGTSSAQNCGASGNGCHNTYDLALLHGKTRTNGCQVTGCHDAINKVMTGASKSCGSGSTGSPCHATYTAASHGGTVTGNETTHTATTASMNTVLDATYNAGGSNTCITCHSAGLGLAHKDTSTTAALWSGNTAWSGTAQNTCYDCHNATTPDNAVASIKTDSWNPNTCDQCHVTRGNGKHARYAAQHVGTESGCSGGSCHGTDLRAAHNNSVTSNAGVAGCAVAGCHDSRDKAMTGANSRKSCGSTGSCHTDKGTTHGSANHDIKNVWETTYKVANSEVTTFTHNGIPYAPSNTIGCGGTAQFNGASAWSCHYSDLIKEHGTAPSGGAGRTLENGGVGCGVCHTDKGGTVGTDANQTVIQNAITANDLRCATCHNGNETNGTASGHVTISSTGAYQKTVTNQIAPEFRSWKTTDGTESSGGHRAYNYLPNWPLGQGTGAVGTINGIAVGTVLDPLGTFTGKTNPRTGATWKFGDVVLCEDCHWFNSAPTGPQGASVPLYVDGQSSRPTTHWYNSIGTQASNPPAPCNKCHTTLNSSVHRSAHPAECQACHIRIPHAWKRPRLLRRVAYSGTAFSPATNVPDVIAGVSSDTEPYATPTQGDSMLSYKITAGQSAFTSNSGCNTNCDATNAWGMSGNGHEATAPFWP